MFLGPDGKPDNAKSRDSALGIGVPGTVAGLALALEKYGSGKFTLARNAAAGDRAGARRLRGRRRSSPIRCRAWSPRLARWPSTAKVFSRADGTPLREGDRLVQADLAATLRRSPRRDRADFTKAPVAEKLSRAVRDAGGLMTPDDLQVLSGR